MIQIKINVQKIEKDRLYKGEKGIYLNAVLIETPDSEYNDYVIIQEVSKDERKAGVKGTIIGNGTIFTKTESTLTEEDSDDLPF